MSLPGNVLSSTPLPAPFMAPRTGLRFNSFYGQTDVHLGGVALGDASQGITYQLWTATIRNGDIWLSAPNTPTAPFLTGVNATWVALAFDQSARPQIAYSTASFNAYWYWYSTLTDTYSTMALGQPVPRVFATLDDSRLLEFSTSDVIVAYLRSGVLYYRQQRDRYGVEYNLGGAPATLVQLGMNMKWRLQFAFQNVQGDNVLPPAEFQQNVDGAINV